MKHSKSYYCYILTNKQNGTLYVGVTSDLIRRVHEHRQGYSKFTKKYQLHELVWFESHQDSVSAITREQQLKKWKRSWKIELIENQNPGWEDLYSSLSQAAPVQDGCLLSQA